MDLTLLDDEDLRSAFGSPTLERGRDYLHSGHVQSVEMRVDLDGDLELTGVVSGTRPTPYACLAWVSLGRDGLQTTGWCTCPVGDGCKHVVAVLLAARLRQLGEGAPAPVWERRLTALLDELEDAPVPHAGAPLALLVDLKPRAGAGRQRSWASAYGPTRGHLRLRPLRQGANGGWVRTGVSWQDSDQLERRGYDPGPAHVLAELEAAHRAATRQPYSGADTHLSLSGFGPALWPALARAAEVGLPLVPGEGLSAVEVADEPAELSVDVSRGETAAHVMAGARLGDAWYAAPDLDVLGETGHGVALWEVGDGARGWALTLARLVRPAGPQLRRLLATGQALAVPDDVEQRLVADFLPRLRRHLPVASSDGSVQLPDPVPPRLALTVTWVAVDEVRLRWTFRYRVGSDDRVYRVDDPHGRLGVRRPKEEQTLVDALELDADGVYRLFGAHRRDHGLVPEQTLRDLAAVAFGTDILPGLEGQVELEEVGARPDYREATGAPVVRFAPRGDGSGATDTTTESTTGAALARGRRPDWLDLEVVVTVDGHAVALAHILEALTRGNTRILLQGGVHLRVDRPELARLAELVAAAGELVDQPADGVRIAPADLGLWDELAEVGIVDAQAAEWVRAARALRGLETLPEAEPVGLEAELRAYQVAGFRWLAFLHQAGLGGILADDMGLGKTLQTLAMVAHARDGGADPFLVVAPTSVVSTWAHEAETCAPRLVVRTVTEAQARRGTSLAALHEGADVVVTSYTLFRLETETYAALAWGGLVLDEAQTVKNHTGKTYQAVRRLDVPFRLALTGTPMENHLMELWSLLSIVAPGLYPWPRRFAETVANPVEREGDRQVLERFRRRIRPFLLRRTKDFVAADLPPKQEQVLEVELTPRHRRVYDTHLQRERQTVLGLVGDLDRHRVAIFRSLTRLRQLSLDAALVSEEYDGIGSAKLDLLVDHLTEVLAEGHRALVFSQFTSFLRRVRARLDDEGIASTYLDGRTRRRGDVVAGFKSGEAAVFLISLKAGGVGLTLTEADYVFVLDPWWNPAVEAQAVDRAHRIGQDRPVMVYRLVSAGTVEEKVMALKARKAALFADVLDAGGEAGTGVLDADDVLELLALPQRAAG
jgi:hypothetical protein